MHGIENDVFCALRGRLTGSLVTRSNGYWDLTRAAWVLDVDQRPSAVVHAVTAQDVAETVAFAAEHGLRVALQGTDSGGTPLRDLSGTIVLKTCSYAAQVRPELAATAP
jgi:FAD/FMN-containing dehydrogenase